MSGSAPQWPSGQAPVWPLGDTSRGYGHGHGNGSTDLRWPLSSSKEFELMPRERESDPLGELESTQAALRENIEASKELIARSEELLDRHREEQAQRGSGRA